VIRVLYQASAFVLIVVGLGLFAVFTIGGSRQERAAATRDRDLRRRQVLATVQANLPVYLLVPCLDEELVIGATVAALAAEVNVWIVVIDDGSSDSTSAVARAHGGEAVMVVRRELPNARHGKGAALNAGFDAVKSIVAERREDPSRVIIGVLDADGRLSPGALDAVRALFDAGDVDAVQLPVQIRNRGKMLTDFQDWEFWGFSALQQHLRGAAGTVSLGGNGQFVRCSTLFSLARSPWTASLTEDLDLALTLSERGAVLRTSAVASVDQQAVETLSALLRQRTRWMQGTIECASHVPAIWRSPALGNLAALEMATAVLAPIVFLLPWSVVFTVSLVSLVVFSTHALIDVASGATGTPGAAAGLSIVLWYIASFAPVVVSAWVYYRRRRRSRLRSQRLSVARVLVLAHLFALYNYVNYVAVWRALGRIVMRRRGWAKTARHQELAR
jgi:cellulose synthase/poly-beta-1,6-N-acetylglucosamine synthase-like glycosyltransferase